MKKLFIAGALSALLAYPAAAAVVVGQSCTPPAGGGLLTQGADNPNQGVLRCAPDLSGTGYTWQLLSPSGTLCGAAFYEVDNPETSTPTCTHNMVMAGCLGVSIQPSCGSIVCPSGFSPINTSWSWGHNPYLFTYNFYSCVQL